MDGDGLTDEKSRVQVAGDWVFGFIDVCMEMGSQTNRWMDGQADGWMGGWIRTGGWTNGLMIGCGWTDDMETSGQTDGWIYGKGQMDGRTNGWMDRREMDTGWIGTTSPWEDKFARLLKG